MAAPEQQPQCQLVTGGGEVSPELDAFAAAVGLDSWGCDYQTVAIMGPQSSGKSTLLNALFRTRFAEMDAQARRGQTTQARLRR